MKGKRIILHYEHKFTGYISDSDYDGNAQFYNEPLNIFYVPARKAKKQLELYARQQGMTVDPSRYFAEGNPRNPHYEYERERVRIMTVLDFISDYGTEALDYLGTISEKDLRRYLLADRLDHRSRYDDY